MEQSSQLSPTILHCLPDVLSSFLSSYKRNLSYLEIVSIVEPEFNHFEVEWTATIYGTELDPPFNTKGTSQVILTITDDRITDIKQWFR